MRNHWSGCSWWEVPALALGGLAILMAFYGLALAFS